MCVWARVWARVCSRARACVRVYVFVRVHVHACACTCMCLHVFVYKRVRVLVYVCVCLCTSAYACARVCVLGDVLLISVFLLKTLEIHNIFEWIRSGCWPMRFILFLNWNIGDHRSWLGAHKSG